MRIHAGKTLEFPFWIGSLVLSISTLICLAVVFSGCTSPSAPDDLYFMRLNLTDFPKLGALDLRRSLSIEGVDGSGLTDEASSVVTSAGESAAESAGHASATMQTAASQASDHLVSLTNELKAHLPPYYSVGLWSYCQGQEDDVLSNCSKPSTTFSFDLLEIFGSVSPGLKDLLPDTSNKILTGYHELSGWPIRTYMLSCVATGLAVILSLTMVVFSWDAKLCEVLVVVFSTLATVFLIAASTIVTVIYLATVAAIKSVLGSLGAQAIIGARILVATWLAVGFSTVATFTWLIILLCCCI